MSDFTNQTPDGRIFDNLVQTLNGMSIYYNDADHTLACEGGRRIERFENYPAATVEYTGGEYNNEGSSARRTQLTLNFVIFFFDNSYNDVYPSKPASRALADVQAQIAKQLMTDHTRGGLCFITTVEEFFTDFKENNGGWIDMLLTMMVSCTLFVNRSDPTVRVD
jgi:hypothetical protein